MVATATLLQNEDQLRTKMAMNLNMVASLFVLYMR